jgi:hypothetical protein
LNLSFFSPGLAFQLPMFFLLLPEYFFLFYKAKNKLKTDQGKDEKRFDSNPFFFVIPPFNFQVGLMG